MPKKTKHSPPLMLSPAVCGFPSPAVLAAGEILPPFCVSGALWCESVADRGNRAGGGPVRGEKGVSGQFRTAPV